MRTIGYCTICKRPRMVTATVAAVATMGPVFGICGECEERQAKETRR